MKNESIAFDHPKVILAGIERIRNKINYTDIVFNMCLNILLWENFKTFMK